MAKNGKHGLVAGVDIGGTKLYTVIADEEGKVRGRGRKKTRAERGFKAVMERVVECALAACDDAKVELKELVAIGVGAPSAIREDGTAVKACNLGWEDVPLGKTLEKLFGKPVFADNDCNVGTLGEFAYGAGKGADTVVGLFVGTGLGGGVVFRGELWRGKNRLATELGHTIVHPGGRKCNCGHQGCLEAYVAKVGMARRLAHEILVQGRSSILTEHVENSDYASLRSGILAEAYRKKDAVVVETLHEAADYLGIGVGNFINTLGPEVVVLGGGVMEALGKDLLDRVREAAKATVYPPALYKDVKICLAALGDDAVALGAAAYAWAEMA